MNNKLHLMIAILLLNLYATKAYSAQPEEMDEERMQQMLENAQKMQDCYSKIDHTAMDELAVKGNKAHHEIKALCEDGKRDEAQQRAMAYSQEMSSSAAMQDLQKCGENVDQTILNMAQLDHGGKDKAGHVCDGI